MSQREVSSFYHQSAQVGDGASNEAIDNCATMANSFGDLNLVDQSIATLIHRFHKMTGRIRALQALGVLQARRDELNDLRHSLNRPSIRPGASSQPTQPKFHRASTPKLRKSKADKSRSKPRVSIAYLKRVDAAGQAYRCDLLRRSAVANDREARQRKREQAALNTADALVAIRAARFRGRTAPPSPLYTCGGGGIDLDDRPEAFQGHFGWRVPPHLSALRSTDKHDATVSARLRARTATGSALSQEITGELLRLGLSNGMLNSASPVLSSSGDGGSTDSADEFDPYTYRELAYLIQGFDLAATPADPAPINYYADPATVNTKDYMQSFDDDLVVYDSVFPLDAFVFDADAQLQVTTGSSDVLLASEWARSPFI